jgi:hypothetical protein
LPDGLDIGRKLSITQKNKKYFEQSLSPTKPKARDQNPVEAFAQPASNMADDLGVSV